MRGLRENFMTGALTGSDGGVYTVSIDGGAAIERRAQRSAFSENGLLFEAVTWTTGCMNGRSGCCIAELCGSFG